MAKKDQPATHLVSAQERIVKELRALVKTQHEISGHLWRLSLRVKLGFIMMAFFFIAGFFYLLVNDI